MLKTTRSSIVSTSRIDDNKVVDGSSGAEADGGSAGRLDISRNSTKSKNQPKSRHLGNSNKLGEPKFLIFGVKEAFNHLRQAFTKAPIFWHFNPKYHIWIKTDVSGYTIRKILSQLISNQLTSDKIIKSSVDWHLVAYFSKKMISTETWYKTHNNELLAIVEVFKMWWHDLEDCKHEVFVLTDHNNLCRFINTKSLSSRQVR